MLVFIKESVYFMSPVSQGVRVYESEPIIKIIGKYILLCNSFVLSRIEFIFGMEALWNDRHQSHTSLLLET